MKTLLSLFDFSGKWSEPFYQNGWEVIQWDNKIDPFLDIMEFTDVEQAHDLLHSDHYDIQGILAAPPCTDFSVSGAQYWGTKDADGRTEKSLQLAGKVMALANLFLPSDPEYFEENPDASFFWAVENPVGRFGKLTGLGKPYYFDPCDFAGWNNIPASVLPELDRIRAKNGIGVTEAENELVLSCNTYTKKTGLWGQFNRDLVKKRIEPVKTAPQGSPLQRLGGKSAKTKELRSNTPDGFALAFYEANKNYQAQYLG